MGTKGIFHRNREGNSQKAKPISSVDFRFDPIDKPRGSEYDQSLDYRRWGGYYQLL